MEAGETERVAREGDEQGLLELSRAPQRAVFSPELQLTVAPNTQAQNDHIFLAMVSGTPLSFSVSEVPSKPNAPQLQKEERIDKTPFLHPHERQDKGSD